MDEVLEYTQLGHFKFLKDSRFDITNQPWAQQMGREVMDAYFKVKRVLEEITRVQVEASRLLAFIDDEETAYRDILGKLRSENDPISFQIQRRLSTLASINQ